jgi:hypothetical protein
MIMSQFHAKYPAKEYRNGEHIGPGPWLALVRESGIFDAPDSVGPWWAGGESEEYFHARIIHHGDGESVSVVGVTEEGSAVLAAAEQRIRLREHGEHMLEVSELRWHRVTVAESEMVDLLKGEPTDDMREGEGVAEWFRRNLTERVLARLLTDDYGKPMSGVTTLPDTEHTLVSFV